jgi:two-component system OmpR family response regulator
MPPDQRGKLRVIVVDDSRDNADSLALLLTLSGYEVRTAYDAATALAFARGECPDCLISDINMPVMDGCELARRVRSEYPAIKLIAVSGRSSAAHVELVREAGFDHEFTKPADPATLLGVLAMMEQVKELAATTRAIAGETKQLLTDVKAEVKEVRAEVLDLKREVRDLKQELRDARREDGEPPVVK